MKIWITLLVFLASFGVYAAEFAPPRDNKITYKKRADRSLVINSPSRNIDISEDSGKVLVLLIEFSDKKHNILYSPGYFYNLLFGSAKGSMKTYYTEQSYGKYNISGYVSEWIEIGKKYSDLGADTTDIDNMNGIVYGVAEGLSKLSKRKNLKEFDANGDGEIDHLIVVHAGNAQEYTGTDGDIWSHRYYVQNSIIQSYGVTGVNIVKNQGYTMQAESSPMGIFAHEFGHDLGLADLYNTMTGNKTVGAYSLMDYGCWSGTIQDDGKPDGTMPTGLSAWEKASLGWISLSTVSSLVDNKERSYFIKNMNKNSEMSAYKIDLAANGSEYIILENRQKTGYDSLLPGSGILAYHIFKGDRKGKSFEYDFEKNILNVNMRRIKIIEADGNNSLGTSSGEGSDFFHATNISQILDRSNNSANTCMWNGNGYVLKSGVNITAISMSGEEMQFKLRRDYSLNFDETGDVDLDDFVILKSKYGGSSNNSHPVLDYNGDGMVDAADLQLIKDGASVNMGGRAW